ncbi:MAG: methionine ABC transporter ATP-binding protein [Clostridiales bacterium]|nr:methionine ABC transporter ATP-binding protein [Clostridiales bacterium]
MIELSSVSKTFLGKTQQEHVEALRDVSLSVKQGEIFGIIGYSGAGKSTLVRVINLLERPDLGRVMMGGQDLTAMNPRELRQARRKIGMIFQHFSLLPSRTVSGNIAFPLKYTGLSKEDIQAKVTTLLNLVELSDKASAYPSQLSGGQKQRVAIARALAADPQVLLCDEATSALDPQTTLSILRLLKKVNEQLGITIVIITHEMAVIKEICDRVAVMEGGRVVELGTVFEVFASPREEITRRFIETTGTMHRVQEMIDGDSPILRLAPGELLVRLQYAQRSPSAPMVSLVSRRFDIDLNILFGNVEIIGGSPLGALVVVASGEANKVQEALAYMMEQNVKVEVLKHG